MILERLTGYPDALYGRIGHPVSWIGRLIAYLDGAFNSPSWSDGARRFAGVGTLTAILIAAGGAGLVAHSLLGAYVSGFAVLVILASTMPAQRSLELHVAAVADALETGGLDAGRKAVSKIVGRDPDRLDEAGVCRAAIESLAENFSDGVVAPAVWLGAGGLVAGAAYKAVNTADSMIGHRTPRHEAFGWACARFDDLVNLPASRLSALLIVAAAGLDETASAGNSMRALLADARRHRSPNAGWPEASMAGALGLALAGPRVYGGKTVPDATMGEGGRREATAADIRKALRLYRIADSLLICGMGGLAALWLAFA